MVCYKIQDRMIGSKYKMGVAVWNGIIRESLIEWVIFDQILEGSEGGSHVVSIASVKTLIQWTE